MREDGGKGKIVLGMKQEEGSLELTGGEMGWVDCHQNPTASWHHQRFIASLCQLRSVGKAP